MIKSLKTTLKKYQGIFSKDFSQLVFILFISALAQGLFIPWMGFYGDDWSLIWLSYKAGSTVSFFPANRFLLTYIYAFFTTLLDPVIWQWQIMFFVIRFCSVVNLWIVLKKLWPSQKRVWFWVSLLFALYPGSLIIYQPATFYVVYLQFSFLFISFWTMLAAIRDNRTCWGLIFISMLFAALNLVTSEYLYFLELLRIPILWIFFTNNKFDRKTTVKNILIYSLPFIITFLIFTIYRLIFHADASSYYHVELSNYLLDPLKTIGYFVNHIINDGYRSGLLTWIKPLTDAELFFYSGLRSILLFGFIAFCSALIIFLFTIKMFGNKKEQSGVVHTMVIAIIALVFAGSPFWIANLPIEIGAANYSRFSIPAAIGSAFLIFSLANLLLRKTRLSNLFLSLICGSAVIMHLLSGNFFRMEWELQNRFLWQLAWRIPDVVPGTTFFSNELPFWTIGENSVAAAINWIYMEDEFPIDHIDYYFYYDLERFERHFPQEKGVNFERSHLAGDFFGNSSNLITFWYQPPACLYILNHSWDAHNPDIPTHLRGLAESYPNDFILPHGNSVNNLEKNPIFSKSNQNNFCYFYQKGILAADNNQWEEVVGLWEQTKSEGLKPSYAFERLPFIQGLAHTNQYEEAFSLSLKIKDISEKYEPLLCAFWEELNQDNSLNQDAINGFIENSLTCFE